MQISTEFSNHSIDPTPVEAEGFYMQRLPLLGRVQLRLRDAEHIAALGLPTSTSTTSTALADGRWLWLGPDEWQWQGEHSEIPLTRLQHTLGEVWHQAVDISDYYVGFRLRGKAIRQVINKGCPLDLGRELAPGQCVPSRISKASVLLLATDAETIEVSVRWSMAEYLWAFLAQSAVSLA